MKNLLYLCFTSLILFSGCNSNSNNPLTSNDVVNLWVGSYQDTYVSCGGDAGGSCIEGSSNFGNVGYLNVAYNTARGDYKRIYVNFLLPNLPAGTEIKKAYLELFHAGTNEDGTHDNLLFQANLATAAWDPMTLTLDNSGPTFSHGTPPSFDIQLRSNNWCGSGPITNILTDAYSDPSSFNGFVIYPVTSDHEKGFDSDNHHSRTAADMGTSPRLLLQVELPSGSSVNDITMPALPTDNDLGFTPGTQIMMLRFRTADDWPADWSVVGRQ